MVDAALRALWTVLPADLDGAELVRGKFLVAISATGALTCLLWLALDPALLFEAERLLLWCFSIASIMAAPLVLRLTSSIMAAWVLQIAAVLTPIIALAALGSPAVNQHTYWLVIMPVLGATVAGPRGLHTAAPLSLLTAAAIALLGQYGFLGDVISGEVLVTPLLAILLVYALMAVQVRLRAHDAASLQTVRADAEVAHEAAVHSDRLSTLGMLASGVAHGVNNPLLSLVQNVEALEAEYAQPKQTMSRFHLRRIVSELSTGLEQVQTAVEALGTFSTTTTSSESTDLEQVLHGVVHLVRQAADPRIRVDMRVTGLGHVAGCSAEVGQIFVNLLVNAVQAIPSDDLEHRIEVVGAPIGDGWIAVEVRDDGEGIPQDLVPRVWEPYFTTRDVGEGVGLGLFVVGNAIRQMGGAAELRSRVGLGTTVRLLLPQVHAERRTPPTSKVPLPPRGNHKARILVIDDESLPLRVVCRALENGYEVLTEDQSIKAHDRLIAGEQVDLIISDVMMPSLTGDELYRSVTDARPDLAGRFVFITGAMLRPGQEEWLRDMRITVLRKPFGIEELRRVVAAKIAEPGQSHATPV